MIAALLAAASAHAGTVEAWVALGDALVHEALGEEEAAAELYRQLSRQLAAEDTARAEALFRLGRLQLQRGEIGEATRAFDDCVRFRAWRARCLTERTEMEIARSAVRTLPTLWTFDSTEHGLIHPFGDENASIRLGVPPGDGDPALLWTDNPKRGESDRLTLGFDLKEGEPERIRLEARSLGAPGLLRVHAEDLDGRLFSEPEALQLDASPRVYDVVLEALVPQDGGAPLAPIDLHRLWLVNERHLEGTTGPATLVIDSFAVL